MTGMTSMVVMGGVRGLCAMTGMHSMTGMRRMFRVILMIGMLIHRNR